MWVPISLPCGIVLLKLIEEGLCRLGSWLFGCFIVVTLSFGFETLSGAETVVKEGSASWGAVALLRVRNIGGHGISAHMARECAVGLQSGVVWRQQCACRERRLE